MSGSILGEISKETPDKSVDTSGPDQVAETLQDVWYWDANTPGQGARPDWLDSKFKSVADKARAHSEAEKRLGSLGPTPEQYDFTKYEAQINPTNEYIMKFVETAKRNRLQQDSVNEIMDSLVGYQASLQPKIDEEIAKLGPNANQKIETVKRWAANHLSQEACDVLGQIANRAEVINFIDEIRQLNLRGQTQPPGNTPAEPFQVYTLEDWEHEIAQNGNKYVNDKKYRDAMSAKLKVIMGEE